MSGPRCKDCRFFVGQKGGGECHRLPPTMVLAPAKNALGALDMVPSAAFPPVTSETWCGEFAAVEVDQAALYGPPGSIRYVG